MNPRPAPPPPLVLIWRVFTFQFSASDLENPRRSDIAVALLLAWLVGVGRYWDHPNAHLLQYLGLGSVVYVFVLSTFLWLLFWPFHPARWAWRSILFFVASASPPALMYAVPVERWMTMQDAQEVNALFLLLVSGWRVALYGVFLFRYAQMSVGKLVVALMLPLFLIIVVLSELNLEKAVFERMGGFRQELPPTSADEAYSMLELLSFLSGMFLPFWMLAYLGWCLTESRRRKRLRIARERS